MFSIYPDVIWDQPSFPAEFLQIRMNEVLNTGNQELDQIISYLLAEPGKMLRPRLVYLASSLYPSDPLIVRDVAVALELIHLASLVHDDVIDHSVMRRGRGSLNSQWGSKASVLVGDYLFAAAFQLINEHNTPAILEKVTRTIQIMCTGEIQQLTSAYQLEMTLPAYLEKIYRKTACLFECCCLVGAFASDMPDEMRDELGSFGTNLGVAYQIIDDVLDFLSTSQRLGKPVGSDLLEGNITLPVIYALQDENIGGLLKNVLANPDDLSHRLTEVLTLLEKGNTFQKALQLAESYLIKAEKALNYLPSHPGRDALKSLSHSLVTDYFHNMAPESVWSVWQ